MVYWQCAGLEPPTLWLRDQHTNHCTILSSLVYLTGANKAQVLDICDFVHLVPPIQVDVSPYAGPAEVLKEYYKAKSAGKKAKTSGSNSDSVGSGEHSHNGQISAVQWYI